MKEIKKGDLTAGSRVQNSPDDFDREFSARYQSEINKISLSKEQERSLSVKLHQARAGGGKANDAQQPQIHRRRIRRAWVATAAAGALLIGALYMLGGPLDLFNQRTTLENGGKAASEEDMGNGFGDGMEVAGNGNDTSAPVDSGVNIEENGNSGSPRPTADEAGGAPIPSRETWEGYFHYRSIGGSNDPHDFYYIVKADENFTRIQVHMRRSDGTIGSGGTIPGGIVPDVVAPDVIDPAVGSGGGMDGSSGNASDLPLDLPGFIEERDALGAEQFMPSSISFFDRVVVEVNSGENWTPLSNASGENEFQLSAQLDALAADLYKPIENGYIIVPTPGEIILGFDFGLVNGQEYRVVLETSDEAILLPFVFNH